MAVKKFSVPPVMAILFVVWGNSDYRPRLQKIGFYCNDTTLRMPYHGDSISAPSLFASILCGGALIIYITDKLCAEGLSVGFKHHLKWFYSGFAYVLAFTELLKITLRELRPHFLSTCQPDFDQAMCSNGLVTDFICTGDGPKWLVDIDIYKSFPSGHASLSFYAFVFLSMHIRTTLLWVRSGFGTLWKHLMPFILFAWTLLCCVSRLFDHRHFWWDVLTGVAIGFIGGIATVNIALNHTKSKERKLSSS